METKGKFTVVGQRICITLFIILILLWCLPERCYPQTKKFVLDPTDCNTLETSFTHSRIGTVTYIMYTIDGDSVGSATNRLWIDIPIISLPDSATYYIMARNEAGYSPPTPSFTVAFRVLPKPNIPDLYIATLDTLLTWNFQGVALTRPRPNNITRIELVGGGQDDPGVIWENIYYEHNMDYHFRIVGGGTGVILSITGIPDQTVFIPFLAPNTAPTDTQTVILPINMGIQRTSLIADPKGYCSVVYFDKRGVGMIEIPEAPYGVMTKVK